MAVFTDYHSWFILYEFRKWLINCPHRALLQAGFDFPKIVFSILFFPYFSETNYLFLLIPLCYRLNYLFILILIIRVLQSLFVWSWLSQLSALFSCFLQLNLKIGKHEATQTLMWLGLIGVNWGTVLKGDCTFLTSGCCETQDGGQKRCQMCKFITIIFDSKPEENFSSWWDYTTGFISVFFLKLLLRCI